MLEDQGLRKSFDTHAHPVETGNSVLGLKFHFVDDRGEETLDAFSASAEGDTSTRVPAYISVSVFSMAQSRTRRSTYLTSGL